LGVVLALGAGGVPSVVAPDEAVPVLAGGGVVPFPCVPPLVAPSPGVPVLVDVGAVPPCWEVGPTEPDEQAAIAAKPIVLASTIAAE
jgi:hypothetical protein